MIEKSACSRAFAGFVSLLLASACGGGAAPAASDSGTPSADAAADAEAPPLDGEADAPPPLDRTGEVVVREVTMWGRMMPMVMVSAGGGFGPIEDVSPPVPIAAEGPCAAYMSSGEEAPTGLDAGEITVVGGPRPLALFHTSGGYGSDMPEGTVNLFDDGDALVATGRGGPDVGPFELEVDAPIGLVPTDNDVVGGGFHVSTSLDRYVGWESDPERRGSIFLEIVSSGLDPVTGEKGTVTVSCAAPDEEFVIVPQALLAHLPVVEAGGGMLMITRSETATATIGTARVEFRVESTLCSMGTIDE